MNWKGNIKIEVPGAETVVLNNLITDAGLDFVRDCLLGDVTDGQIKYTALGNSTTATANDQTALGGEQFRKAITTYSTGSTGEAETLTYIAPAEGVFHIKEIGWFAGSAASTVADSGVMIARVLYDRDKTNVESIQIRRTDTFGRST